MLMDKVGLDEIISLVPIYGDIVAGILGLYQVYLSALFGIEWQVLGWMVCDTDRLSHRSALELNTCLISL